MTKYLNYKLENLLVNEIEGYIRNCIDNQYIKYSKKIDADDDDDNADEVIDDLILKCLIIIRLDLTLKTI